MASSRPKLIPTWSGDHGPYQRCSLDKNQIRLLTLSTTAMDTYQLQVFDIDSCPTYVALSYEWGDWASGWSPTIMVNGVRGFCGRNLYDALQSIAYHFFDAKSASWYGRKFGYRTLGSSRSYADCTQVDESSLPRHFWIDALCIDQFSGIECGQQVQLMGDIYSYADRVLVYLPPICNLVIGTLRRTYEVAAESGRNPDSLVGEDPSAIKQRRYAWSQRWDPRQQFQFRRSGYTSSDDTSIWNLANDVAPLRQFLESTYWTRIWIVQEFVLAQDVLFITSDQSVELSSFWSHLSGTKQHEWQIPPSRSPFYNVIKLRMKQERATGRISYPFPQLPFIIRDLQRSACSMFQDRVYALLGLIDWSATPHIKPLPPLYTIDKAELAMELGRRLEVAGDQMYFAWALGTIQKALRWDNISWTDFRLTEIPVGLPFEVKEVTQEILELSADNATTKHRASLSIVPEQNSLHTSILNKHFMYQLALIPKVRHRYLNLKDKLQREPSCVEMYLTLRDLQPSRCVVWAAVDERFRTWLYTGDSTSLTVSNWMRRLAMHTREADWWLHWQRKHYESQELWCHKLKHLRVPPITIPGTFELENTWITEPPEHTWMCQIEFDLKRAQEWRLLQCYRYEQQKWVSPPVLHELLALA